MGAGMIHLMGDTRDRCPWAHLLSGPSLGAPRLEFSKDSVIYESRTPARQLYYIETGQVRTHEPGENESARLIQILGPGDWFGEEALVPASVHSTRAIAASAVTVSAVTVEKLIELLAHEPKI